MERHLAGLLSGDRARERSALALSLILGVWLMRSIIGNTALAAGPGGLERQLEGLPASCWKTPHRGPGPRPARPRPEQAGSDAVTTPTCRQPDTPAASPAANRA
ncbi:hypothetical protein [Streptomyces sp. NPDC048521]|uniref:hypothetical protein n=1 Tax=Streptomyces sp. NPDC048521 TaxID=3365566 RepID=UPI0037134B82